MKFYMTRNTLINLHKCAAIRKSYDAVADVYSIDFVAVSIFERIRYKDKTTRDMEFAKICRILEINNDVS